jgi:magnesium chelatase subunit I
MLLTNAPEPAILPYSWIVGQADIKLALALSYVEPQLLGVLISGKRGAAKSTAVRAFARLALGQLPVTLPINATEDRVVGGWRIEQLLDSKPDWQPGLLEEANGSMLYVDEVNLLDDHIVNLLLDVASTGVLVVQREGRREQKAVRFSLVGTMNPAEGLLRPQLLDRFGLMAEAVPVAGERVQIILNRLAFDDAQHGDSGKSAEELQKATEELRKAEGEDGELRRRLERARARVGQVTFEDNVLDRCVQLAERFEVEGHRGELMLALAARAHAAWQAKEDDQAVSAGFDDVRAVARLALQHRRKESTSGGRPGWDLEKDGGVVQEVCQ